MIAIYTPKTSARLRYITTELWTHMQGIGVELITDIEQFRSLPAEQPKICYAAEQPCRSLQIKPSTLLFETGIKPLEPDVEQDDKGWHMLRTNNSQKEDTYAFDVFAASFYLLTRYEEYNDTAPDQHGRFKAENSTAYKNGFLEEPVVDQWMRQLLGQLTSLFPNTPKSKRHYKHIHTIDVDNVFAYRHKGILINGLHLALDLAKGRTALFKQRLKATLRLEEDPFFNLQELADTLLPEAASTWFFFHCGCYGKHDKKVWFPSLRYAEIRKKIAEMGFNVGLHPSYRSTHRPWILRIEKKMLEWRIGKEVNQCRAHYLLFTLPNDYRTLLAEGITDDWTMGYSNNPGFRAGTSLPFHFYDLERDEATKLVIHPLAVMDKTLHSNMGLDAEGAKAYIERLAKKVRAVDGELVTLFHNENQTDAEGFGWQGWNKALREMIDNRP